MNRNEGKIANRPERFPLLFEKFLDGTLTDNDRAILKGILDTDMDAQKEFAAGMAQEAAMRELLTENLAAGLGIQTMHEIPTSVPKQRKHHASGKPGHPVSSLSRRKGRSLSRAKPVLWWLISAAAGIAVIIGALHYNKHMAGKAPSPVRAKIIETTPDVTIVRQGKILSSEPGMEIQLEDTLRTGPRGKVKVMYSGESTTFNMEENSGVTLREKTGTKHLFISKGTVKCNVYKQPPGKSMVITTPHSEAEIEGTYLIFSVTPSASRLDVIDGRIKLTRLSDMKTIEVTGGYYAVTGPNDTPFIAKKIYEPVKEEAQIYVIEQFDGILEDSTVWQIFKGGFPTTFNRQLEIDLSPRPTDPYPGTWHIQGGVISKQAYPLPLRISVEVYVTHASNNIIGSIAIVPDIAALNSKTGAPDTKDAIRVDFRHDVIGVIKDISKSIVRYKHASRATRYGKCIVEFDNTSVRVWVKGRKIIDCIHEKPVFKGYYIGLWANAKRSVPKGAKVQFENLYAEELITGEK